MKKLGVQAPFSHASSDTRQSMEGGIGATPRPGRTGIDSDDEFFQSQEDATATEGDPLTPNEKSARTQAEKISEAFYREAYLYVHGIAPPKGRGKKVIYIFSSFSCVMRLGSIFHLMK